jgi:hypothetical protein
MKNLVFFTIFSDVLTRQLPFNTLFQQCLTQPNEFIQSIIDNNESQFFKLLPQQTRKDLNTVYSATENKYLSLKNEDPVNKIRTVFFTSLKNENPKMINALIDTGKIDFNYISYEGIDQFAQLCLSGHTECTERALKYITNFSKIKRLSYLECLSYSKFTSSTYCAQLEVKIAKKMIDSGINLNHVGNKKEGNALNRAVKLGKSELIDLLLHTEIDRNYSENTLKLFGSGVVHAYLYSRYDFDRVKRVIKPLLIHGIDYQEDMKILEGYISENEFHDTFKVVKDYISIFEEKKQLESSLDNASHTNQEKNIYSKRKI